MSLFILNLITLYLSPPLFAHQMHELHYDCLQAKDYLGCINKNQNKSHKNFYLNPAKILWKDYGPIKIDWSSWKRKDSSFIAISLDPNGKLFFIAVNSNSNLINVSTSSNQKWKGWLEAKQEFEKLLVKDFCFEFYE